MKAHEIVLDLLNEAGVNEIFTLMSEDTMSLMSKIEAEWDDRIQLIKTRHEQGAMAMADGYARTNEFGVCLVGRGPAVAQTGTALVTARKNGSNLLVITPEAPLSDEYDIKEFEQETYLRSTIGDVVSIRSHDTLVSDFREALRRVKLGDGPVAVQVPWDLFDADIDPPDELGSVGFPDPERSNDSGAHVHPDEDLVERAVDMYLDADAYQPPVVLAGRGAVQAEAKEAIEAFAERTSALLASSLQARNYFADHPYYLGFTGSWGTTLANRYANESDLVFAVGASLNPYTMDEGHVLGDDTTLVHIDADPGSIGRYTDVDLGITGDARVTIEALSEALERAGIDRDGELWSADLKTRIEESLPMNEREYPEVPGTVDPRELVVSLDRLLPENKKVVTDAGHFTRWVMDGIQTPPDDFTFTLDFAAVGLGLPMGIGTAVAAEDYPCITVCGDAGLLMSIQELETAVRNDISITIIVVNDSSLGSEYHSLDQGGEPPEVALVPSPDFAAIAESVGAEGYTVQNIEELAEISAVFDGSSEGPVVVDCKVNHEVRHRSKM